MRQGGTNKIDRSYETSGQVAKHRRGRETRKGREGGASQSVLLLLSVMGAICPLCRGKVLGEVDSWGFGELDLGSFAVSVFDGGGLDFGLGLFVDVGFVFFTNRRLAIVGPE